jgi:hypothetical protein
MLKEVEIPECPVPTRAKPWSMRLVRDGDACCVMIRGNGGGMKASFMVQMADLANGVKELQKG